MVVVALLLMMIVMMTVGHVELSKDHLELIAPDLEVPELLDCGLLRREHQHHVLLVVLADDHLHLRVGSVIQVVKKGH